MRAPIKYNHTDLLEELYSIEVLSFNDINLSASLTIDHIVAIVCTHWCIDNNIIITNII